MGIFYDESSCGNLGDLPKPIKIKGSEGIVYGNYFAFPPLMRLEIQLEENYSHFRKQVNKLINERSNNA